LLKTKYDLTYQKIGSLFGGKDHSTVMHGCTQMEEYVKSDPMTKKNVENVLRKMGKDPNAIQ
jgi:chromosomal replication initiator protein